MTKGFVVAHELCYVVYTDLTKIYHYLKEIYPWNSMKRDVVNFVAKYMVCQQVKVENIRPGKLYQDIDIPELK